MLFQHFSTILTCATLYFRVVRQKNYVEQEEIQREAMIPSKEAKLFTYKLLEEHYLQAKPIRKPGGGGTGMAKCFFLFHVNQQQVIETLQKVPTLKIDIKQPCNTDRVNAVGNMLQVTIQLDDTVVF